jgi:hypothetical protein
MYKDKHGKEIKAGMTIRHDCGCTDKVYLYAKSFYGETDLGVNATNPNYKKHHPNCEQEYYSLKNYNLKEWETIKEDVDNP